MRENKGDLRVGDVIGLLAALLLAICALLNFLEYLHYSGGEKFYLLICYLLLFPTVVLLLFSLMFISAGKAKRIWIAAFALSAIATVCVLVPLMRQSLPDITPLLPPTNRR